MKKIFLLFIPFLLLMVSCNGSNEVNNPFATPEGCVLEYLDARDSCDVARMLNCYLYDTKYERIFRERMEKSLEEISKDKKNYPDFYYKTDSVKLKNTYPNTAVVTVYVTQGYIKDHRSSVSFDVNLVKDSDNWKLDTQ